MANQVTTLRMERKFKQTPAGEIPVDWECYQLGELADICGGGTPDRTNSEYWGGQIPWATPTDVTCVQGTTISNTKETISDLGLKNSAATLMPSGAILMTSRATLGYAVINTVPMATNQGFANFICKENIHNRFLRYLLCHRKNDLKRLGAGSTFLEIPKTVLRKLVVQAPPLREQKKIAEILSSVDDAIEKTNSVAARIGALKKGLTQHFLTHGLGNSRTLKKSIIGPIPSQWDVVSLENVCLKVQDGTHFSPKSKDGPYMYITSKNIRMGRMDLSDVARISEEEHRPIYRRADVRKGDVLLTKDGAQAGNIAINTIEEEFSLLSSVAMLRPNGEITSAEWIHQFYASERGQQLIRSHIAGQAITRLTLEKINALPFALPSPHEQNAITTVLSGIDSSIEYVKTHVVCLASIKEGLMQALLTGRIRVFPWIEKHGQA